jgi:hypothetical protein
MWPLLVRSKPSNKPSAVSELTDRRHLTDLTTRLIAVIPSSLNEFLIEKNQFIHKRIDSFAVVRSSSNEYLRIRSHPWFYSLRKSLEYSHHQMPYRQSTKLNLTVTEDILVNGAVFQVLDPAFLQNYMDFETKWCQHNIAPPRRSRRRFLKCLYSSSKVN